MHPVRISAAAFAPVYPHVLEISIFHFRVARYSRRTGSQRRKESEFAIRVSGWDVFCTDFAFLPHLYYTGLYSDVSNVTIMGLFPHKVIESYNVCPSLSLLETWAWTKDGFIKLRFCLYNLLINMPGLRFTVQQSLKIKSILRNSFSLNILTRYNKIHYYNLN